MNVECDGSSCVGGVSDAGWMNGKRRGCWGGWDLSSIGAPTMIEGSPRLVKVTEI